MELHNSSKTFYVVLFIMQNYIEIIGLTPSWPPTAAHQRYRTANLSDSLHSGLCKVWQQPDGSSNLGDL
ncbi:18677_t:CDS:2 [Gigaspora rosea]|nr:18677_t:CDS:2 [Gigaspora rosea]